MGMGNSAHSTEQSANLDEPSELLGDELGEEVFETWAARQFADSPAGDDSVVMKTSQALAGDV